jgi:hypothetical protein
MVRALGISTVELDVITTVVQDSLHRQLQYGAMHHIRRCTFPFFAQVFFDAGDPIVS